MAVFGEVILFLLGLFIFVVGIILSLAASTFSGNKRELSWMLIPACVGACIMYAAIHYGPIVLSIGG